MSKILISKRFRSHETDSDGAIKKLKGQNKQSKKYDINKLLKKQEQDELSKLLKKQGDELNKFKKKTKKDIYLDDAIKELEKQKQDEKNKILERQKDEKNKILEKQKDELNKLLENTKNKQEEDIDWDEIIELTKNINSRSPTNLRTFTPRRDPFDDINKNKKKLTPPLSKVPAPIPKSREPQDVAAGKQAGIQVMKIELKTSKDYVRHLKKQLENTEFLSENI